MSDGRRIYKAGKLSFLLVCLFLCTACGKQKAVFVAGAGADRAVQTKAEETKAEETKAEETKAEETKAAETKAAEETEKSESTEDTSSNLPVNINTAGTEELMTLPGIGQVRAAAIIAYREEEGKFEKKEDIMNVKGIGTGIFSKINSLICVK